MIRVRPGRPDDVDLVAEFQRRMARESEGLRLDPRTVRRGVKAVFDDPAKGRYWIAEADGHAAGCLLVIPEWSDWRCGTVWWIHSLYVRPEFRRRGVFRALYEHLCRKVERQAALKGLRLIVDRRNRRAQRAYEALGMDADHYQTYEWLKSPARRRRPAAARKPRGRRRTPKR